MGSVHEWVTEQATALSRLIKYGSLQLPDIYVQVHTTFPSSQHAFIPSYNKKKS